MSLRSQLHTLQRQQRQELRALHHAALRTRAGLDPKRLIRHHPIATLSTAAIAGMMLAPRPTPRFIVAERPTDIPTSHNGASHAPRHRLAWLWRAILRAIPAAQNFAPDQSPPPPSPEPAPAPAAGAAAQGTPPHPHEPAHALDGILESLATQAIITLLTQIDLPAVARAWYEGITGKTSQDQSSNGHDQSGHQPPDHDSENPEDRTPTPDL